MHNYRTLVVLGLTCAAASALMVPNVLSPELYGSLLTGSDTGSEAASLLERHEGGDDTSGGRAGGYPRSHSYHSTYDFSARDGWESIPITDLSYKYGNVTSTNSATSAPKRQRSAVKRSVKVGVGANAIGGTVSHAVGETWNSLKGLGKAQGVTITWYTGEDLQNPSCWPESDWAPTDASFACALTLEGWTKKPSCFKFLELCNGPDKCIFVRVVDTCAGCKIGSKHVDLTKAAFAELADLDVGILTVQMRMASDPRSWHKELWGPKVQGKA